METINKDIVSALNELVQINNDRIEGYETAMEETDDADLKSLFSKMASHSRAFKTELSDEITKAGETPTSGTKASGKLYRIWMDIKVAVAAKDRTAVLSNCEFGEDAALETYDKALDTHSDLPDGIRKLIVKQRDEIQKDHDEVKRLRDMNK
jgi:uncharacterized protein (TIGR02284 family)